MIKCIIRKVCKVGKNLYPIKSTHFVVATSVIEQLHSYVAIAKH